MDDKIELDHRQLERNISMLSSNEHREILALLPPELVSTNGNGAFCDLATLPEDVLGRVRAFVAFSVENNVQLEAYDRGMQETAALLNCALPATTVCAAATRCEARPPARDPPAAQQRVPACLAFMRRSGDARERQVPHTVLEEE